MTSPIVGNSPDDDLHGLIFDYHVGTFDVEHHADHLVVHPLDSQYFYDPVCHFIIVRPD